MKARLCLGFLFALNAQHRRRGIFIAARLALRAARCAVPRGGGRSVGPTKRHAGVTLAPRRPNAGTTMAL